jgi:hypothetical protein
MHPKLANKFRILLDRGVFDKMLSFRDTPLTEYLAKRPKTDDNRVHLMQVSFSDQDYQSLNLADAIVTMSEKAFFDSPERPDFYTPVISVGFMDVAGNIYPMHQDYQLEMGIYDWDSGRKEIKDGEIPLTFLIDGVIQKAVSSMLDPVSRSQDHQVYWIRDLRVIVMTGVFISHDCQNQTLPIVMFRVYAILDKLEDALPEEYLKMAKDQADPEALLEKAIMHPVPFTEFSRLYAEHMKQEPKYLLQWMSRAVSHMTTPDALSTVLANALAEFKQANEKPVATGEKPNE